MDRSWSATEHSAFLTFWVSLAVLLFKCLSTLVIGPIGSTKNLSSSAEPGTEIEQFGADATSPSLVETVLQKVEVSIQQPCEVWLAKF